MVTPSRYKNGSPRKRQLKRSVGREYRPASLQSTWARDLDHALVRAVASERWFAILSASPSPAHRRLAAAIALGVARVAPPRVGQTDLILETSTRTRDGRPLEWLRNHLLHAFPIGESFSMCGVRRSMCERPFPALEHPENHLAACVRCQESAFRKTRLCKVAPQEVGCSVGLEVPRVGHTGSIPGNL